MLPRIELFAAPILCALCCVSASSSDSTVTDSSRESIASLTPMVVVGRRNSSYAVSNSVILTQEVAGRQSSVGDLLNTLCGVTVYRTGGLGAYSDMSIRGSGSNQVQVYLDGMPLNTASGGAVDLSKIPLNLLRQATVYKSTAPLELSGLNAGGVIELSTDPEAAGRVVSGVAEAGSYGYFKGGALIASSARGTAQRLSVDFAHCDNDYPYIHEPFKYGDGNGALKTVDNHAFTSVSAVYAQSLSVDSGRHTLSGQVFGSHAREGLFDYLHPDSNDGYSRDRTIALIGKYTGSLWDVATLGVDLTAKTRQNVFQRITPYYIGSPGKRRTEYPRADGTVTARMGTGEAVSFKGLLGGSYDGFTEENLWADDANGLRPYADRRSARGGLEATLNASDILFARCKGLVVYEIDSTNGISYQYGSWIEAPARRTEKLFPSAQAEIRFQHGLPLALSLCGTYGTRSPSMMEKFSRGSRSIGNASLQEETRTEIELGVSLDYPRLSTTLVGYGSRTRDKIRWLVQSQNMMIPRNIGTVEGFGIEWDISLSPYEWLSITNALTLMSNTITDSDVAYWGGNDEPMLPRVKERNEVRLALPWFSLGHTLLYHSRYYLGPQNLGYIEPDLECGAFVSLNRFERWTLTYRIDNYVDKVGFTADGDEYFERRPRPGRMHYLILRMES